MYWLGVVFIVLVAVIWSASSIVAQYLYTDRDFHSPFLLTYIGTSLFILFLPLKLLQERCQCRNNPEEEHPIIPWTTTTVTYEPIPSSTSEEENEDTESTQDAGRIQNGSSNSSSELLSHAQHFQIAYKIAPIWFISNFTYNASLEFTSITSSTVLASTGSLFTFLFALLTGDERFRLSSLSGVLLGVFGSCLTAWSDVHHYHHNVDSTSGGDDDVVLLRRFMDDDEYWNVTNTTTFAPTEVQAEQQDTFGDVLGLLSAMGYGAYTILIRLLCPHDERQYSMQYILGYIGLVNGLSLLPIVLYQCVFRSNGDTITLSSFVWMCLIIKGLFDNVLSDYLWARAVMLTSATVATVGTGLTIPLALLTDYVWHDDAGGWKKLGGAFAVLTGFVLVNIGGSSSNDDDVVDSNSDDHVGTVELSSEETNSADNSSALATPTHKDNSSVII